MAVDAGVHLALLVEELGPVVERNDRRVPDAWMDVEALRAVAIEGDEMFRAQVVAGQGQGGYERLPRLREEQLTAVGMVVKVANQGARAVGVGRRFGSLVGWRVQAIT